MIEIEILGEKYSIRSDGDNNPKLIDANAYVEFYSKEIVYHKNLFLQDDCRKLDHIADFGKKVLRHEALHAFFHECGCSSWAEDETLVEFLAVQYPKIRKLCDTLGALTSIEEGLVKETNVVRHLFDMYNSMNSAEEKSNISDK